MIKSATALHFKRNHISNSHSQKSRPSIYSVYIMIIVCVCVSEFDSLSNSWGIELSSGKDN